MRVAILYICTGKYSIFWKEFYESFEKNFLRSCKKTYFVFCDHSHLPYMENDNVCYIEQKDLGWPNNTLHRFSLFIREEDRWKDYDYVLFVNANFLCVDNVLEEEFLPLEDNLNLFVAEHAGHHGKAPIDLPYERNENSLAYVKEHEGEYYVMGGLNGGRTREYMSMVHELKNRVDKDAEEGIIAKCHDESHLNRYIIGRSDVKILPPCYGYPEGWNLPYNPKMFIRDKSKYFDVEALKAGNLFGRIKLYLGRLKSKVAIRIRIRKVISWFKRGV